MTELTKAVHQVPESSVPRPTPRPRGMAGSPHDTLVKKTFSIAANAEGEFRAILPAQVSALVDWATLKNEPGSFVDPDARAWHTDLLFSARLAGRRALLYLLLEHQSRVDRWMPKRMLTYIDRIWTAEREAGATHLPVVLPMVLHHSERGWTAGRHMHALFNVSADVLDVVRHSLMSRRRIPLGPTDSPPFDLDRAIAVSST